MNKHLIVSLLAGTTAVLCGIAQEPQHPPPPQPEGIGGQCPMRQPKEGMEGQCPMMRGPMSEAPGQMPQMRGMANQGRQMPGESAPRRLFADPEAMKAAGATDEQLLTFKTFMKEFRMKQIDLRASVEKAELALQLLEAEPKSDEATLLKATDAISAARAELFRQETLMKTKTKSIFGEDVIKKLFEAHQKKQSQRPQIQQGQGERQGQQRQGTAPRMQAPSAPEGK